MRIILKGNSASLNPRTICCVDDLNPRTGEAGRQMGGRNWEKKGRGRRNEREGLGKEEGTKKWRHGGRTEG